MHIRHSVLATAIVLLLVLPNDAFAWGPAMHVGLADGMLERLGMLPAGVAAILARHRIAYVYGNIAADVVFAKRWSRVKQFCHHWSTGFRLHGNATTDMERAFSYGYLSHLAADTVAHGKYVPRQIVVSGCTMNFGHLYWELRADAVQGESTWRRLEHVLGYDHDAHHDTLARHMTDTILPYDINRMLFDRLIALAIRPGFRRTIGVWNRRSRWHLCPELLDGYRSECLDRIMSILSQGDQSPLLREDPNGTSALMQVRARRREARRMLRGGLSAHHHMREVSRGWAPRAVLQSMEKPIAGVVPSGSGRRVTERPTPA